MVIPQNTIFALNTSMDLNEINRKYSLLYLPPLHFKKSFQGFSFVSKDLSLPVVLSPFSLKESLLVVLNFCCQ